VNNVWHDAEIGNDGTQYYQFQAEAGLLYEVTWDDSYNGSGSKTGDVEVSAYYKNYTETVIEQTDSGYTTPKTFTAPYTGYVIIKVYARYRDGTYRVKYSDGSPGYTPLVNGEWFDDSVGSGESDFYQLHARAGKTYRISWNDSYQGNGTKTGDVKVSAEWAAGGGNLFSGVDNGYATPQVVNADRTGYIIIKVEPWDSNGSYAGSYAVKYEEVAGQSSGQVSITLSGAGDETINLNESTGSNLSKSGGGSLYLNISGSYSRYQWILDGQDLLKDETSSSTTLYASNMSVGIHHLTVVVYKGQTPYSKKLTFTVTP
jgi:hypothetical protein